MRFMRYTIIALAAFVVSACGAPPKERYYTLSAADPSVAHAIVTNYSIVVGPVTLPDVVDRQQLVTRSGPHTVEISELNRWSESLKSAIPRVIATHLSRLLGSPRVAAYPAAVINPEFRVLIDVQRFESAPGKEIVIEALWRVHCVDKEAPQNGRTTIREPANAGYDGMVAAHERALSRLSEDIAATVRALASTRVPENR